MKDSQAIVTPLGVSGASIKLDSSEWFDWLSERSSFSYQSAISDYTCNKRSNGKWYASKRKGDRSQGSKSLAQEYLGSGDKVTKAKLEEIARKFALPDREYWYLKHPKPKTGEPTASLGAGCTTDKGTTNKEGTPQPSNEIAEPRAEFEQSLTELQAQLRECQHRCIHLENEKNRLERLGQDYSQETVARLSSKYTKALKDIDHWKETAESYKRQAAKLREQVEVTQPSVDAATLFNQLRPLLNRLSDRDRRAIQQKLEEIVE